MTNVRRNTILRNLVWPHALRFGLLGGLIGVVVDFDHLFHYPFGTPYRFLHTPIPILDSVLAVICVLTKFSN